MHETDKKIINKATEIPSISVCYYINFLKLAETKCHSEFHFPSAFNSSPVLPPCLRRRSARPVLFPWIAASSGVSPAAPPCALTFAPLAISRSTFSLRPIKAAECKGVLLTGCVTWLYLWLYEIRRWGIGHLLLKPSKME